MVGRTTMMVRNTVVSTCDALDPVFHDTQRDAMWTWLQLEPDSHIHPHYFVVINEACVPVTAACFQRIQLEALKQQFQQVECFRESNFIYIRYKVGLLFKRLPGTDVWVPPKDMVFWAQKLLQLNTMEALIERFGYDFITSFHVDLNPLFMHNAFPKNTLAFNALKNAVLATDARYAHYFMDSLSAYARQLTPHHQIVQEPVQDGI
ncbi:RNA_pol_Rpb2_6 domain-containing protein [Trichonephila clavata]|uniref:RNA_pol_Rpb2_6 domain-containing protein n=1 Tax=Trichonephila clavata TaxID=2740835 RepID=A0A8X6LDN7_TRICU|nr:RNA_pol_Rpb2_6 domain-containing protein [Trichonephila clavata]